MQREAEGKSSKVNFLQGNGEMVEVGVVARAPEEPFPFVGITGRSTEESQLFGVGKWGWSPEAVYTFTP